MNIRTLTAAEVTFEFEIVPDESHTVRGSFSSGDEEQDRADEDSILERLSRGEIEAWCGIVVKASYKGFEGTASIWGCSYETGFDHKQVACDEYGLDAEALDDLNAAIAEMADKLEDLVQ